ncbi:MAG: dihydrolipoyl dehydrogenase [Saprospiraceae bacterium]|nr:dihydrolipoyl dehydrogenase [Candidatus Vicinibacter affinis]MBP6173916.1 dihydrolipoyl dehydrogenase [Saprospiraceae bacterium]MBK7696671.1 dihydrolipoyl dehydrogenase [Candidatus Vicinibacter affinis]MBK7800754.1 dihydrolipoyl dehydrogenase [Candidatus Vicinibacter affinis]MBK9641318.1 dihydrolipoyl dehydrogenase [Candidatus Vicinibacter affinis]
MTDLAIIGSGPGGYVAAIRAAQLGFQVTLIEKYPTLGGTCLNVGCIPSKALLDSSELFYQAKKTFISHGIKLENLEVEVSQMFKRKEEVVSQNTKGIEFLMKKNKITVINGMASFSGPQELSIDAGNGKVEKLEFKKCIIATGSKPNIPTAFNYDKKRVISSTEALSLKEIPKSMVIIGAGVIGLELGSVYARLGTKVSILEFMDRILPGMDLDCAKELQKSLQSTGIKFHLSQSVESVQVQENKALVKYRPKSGGDVMEIEADYCLVCIGRKPYTDGLKADLAGVEIDEKGRIKVDDFLRTKNPHIYAIGDVVNGAMLAHKAEEEGVFVAEVLAGQKPHIDYNLIPGVVYTWPEMASVGKTEEQLKLDGRLYKTGKFPYKALGRARASMDLDGLVKVIADEKTDEVLGVHLVGARAADMIMEAVALMEFRGSAEDMARICHPHPTYTEALKEAALDATAKRSIHS